MRHVIRAQTLILAVASSYLTLMVFATEQARELWWPYGIVMLVLAVANLRRDRHGD